MEIDRLFDHALASQASEDWAAAQQSCIALIKLDCLEWRGRDISRLLMDVREKDLQGKKDQIDKIESTYALGKKAFESKDWAKALSIWESVDPGILSSRFSNFPQEYAHAQEPRDATQAASIFHTSDSEKSTGAKNVGQHNYLRKFTADFSFEMSRSVAAMLKNWSVE
jgi:hypothetical protein